MLKSLSTQLALLCSLCLPSQAQDLPQIEGVAAQPLVAQVRRVMQALEIAGAPMAPDTIAAIEHACGLSDYDEVVASLQRALDPLCLALIHINPESRVKVATGAVARELAQGGWRIFLLKVHNEAGVTGALRVTSPNAELPYARSTNKPEPKVRIAEAAVRDRWLEVELMNGRPLTPELSGLALEYRLIGLYSRDDGPREAKLSFDVGQGTQDLGFRGELNTLFDCAPAVPVTLRVIDFDGKPTTACFTVRDERGRIYPSRSRRLEPDFFFQNQVYRADGEQLHLPAGPYSVTYTRGPEYQKLQRTIQIPNAASHTETFKLERWIHLAAMGWYSGDHHIHAAGCAHYDAPTQGVLPETMLRHLMGEDVNVGCVLTWGPCWYFQKRFFEGGTSELSQPGYVMRYDVEVSGFPSSHAGHICLLRMSEDDYPGVERIEDWPTWDLPILQWAKSQGAITGFAHSGFGLAVSGTELPTLEMPRFDSIGANEYIVDVAHGAVDFISTVDTPAIWELNIWYHTLNAGFETRISGETDFPCIYGERVGIGRSYIQLDEGAELNYEAWVRGLRDGRSYVSDGRSHLIDFSVGSMAVGHQGSALRPSVLAAKSGESLKIRARVAAQLPEKVRGNVRSRPLAQKPYWHLERARLGATRRVEVELIINGIAVEKIELEADGKQRDISFDFKPEVSSWVALRIFPSSHTNPVFVEVDGKPIRASRKSAEWCAQAVEVCWRSKVGRIRESEREAARAAYDLAAAEYKRRAEESVD